MSQFYLSDHSQDDARYAWKEQQKRSQVGRTLDKIRAQVEKHGGKAYFARLRIEAVWVQQRVTARYEPEAVFATARETFKMLFLALLFPAAYFISLLLIYRPTEYLVNQHFGADSTKAAIAMHALPITFILLQIGVSLRLAHAQQMAEDERFWQFIGRLMVIITPTMLSATFLARSVTGLARMSAYEILLMLALVLLAYITDAVIVYSGNETARVFAFICLKVIGLWQTGRLYHLRSRYRHHMAQVARLSWKFHEEWESYNLTHPRTPLEQPPFSATTRRVLDGWN